MQITKLLTSITVAGALLAACGGDDDDGGGGATSTTVVDEVAVSAALQGQLLTVADLATDDPLDAQWGAGDVQEGVDIQLPDCLVEEPHGTPLASVEAKFVTQNDLKLPSLEEDLTRYADEAGAEAAYDVAAARLDGCDAAFVFQGTPSQGTIERLPLVLLGDQAAAWRTSVTIAGAAVSVTTIQVQDGDLLLSLVHTDLAVPDTALLESYAAKAVAALD